MKRPQIAQALLRPAFAPLYPGIPPNEWRPAAVMTDQVLAIRINTKHQVPVTRDRALDTAHFEFRTVASAGSTTAQRESRSEERRSAKERPVGSG
jgi:hypothetical protein